MPKVIDSFTGDYEFLSNFSYARTLGATVEHYYQAAKTDDPEWVARIMLAQTPGEAKKLGRRAPLREDWEQTKVAVMRSLLLRKFSDDTLARKLMRTKDAKLIEGNDWGDRYWGKVNGKGKNMLGKLLMEIREVLFIAEKI